tara:strand:- start:803 stop:1570 length:768 start_codon:yes stop_codon:yes gene_type:complete
MIILIGHGFVGTAIASYMRHFGISFNHVSHRNLGAIRDADSVINAAGYIGQPNVDACEINRMACAEGNILFPLILAESCKRYGKKLVHVSSGCIYQGSGDYTESDAPNFQDSFYSFTKAAAETALRGYDVRLMRIRMPFLDGVHPRCVLAKLKGYAKWIDGENSITYLPEAAAAAVTLTNEPAGTYNVTNPGTITNRQIAEYMGVTPQWWDEGDFFNKHAPRSFCTLNSEKMQEIMPMRNVHEIFTDIFEQRKVA